MERDTIPGTLSPYFTGKDVEFNWTVYTMMAIELEGQNISHIFPEAGNYTLAVRAHNGYSQDTLHDVVEVMDPITQVCDLM